MAYNLRQIYTWDDERRSSDVLFINIDQIDVIELYAEYPDFDPQDEFLSFNDGSQVLGLSVWQITMSSGRRLHVPVPRNWRTNIWEQLNIEVP